jgi:hypothetical protein
VLPHARSTCVPTGAHVPQSKQNPSDPLFQPCCRRCWGRRATNSATAPASNHPFPKPQTRFNTHRCRVRRKRQRPRSNAPIEGAPARTSRLPRGLLRRGTSDWVIAFPKPSWQNTKSFLIEKVFHSTGDEGASYEVDPIVWTEFCRFLDGAAGCPGGGPKAAIHSGLESALGSHPCVALSSYQAPPLCQSRMFTKTKPSTLEKKQR